jgi:hypothetical protein
MRWKDIRWGAALGGMLVAEVAQIAAAFVWVVLYSYLVHPGETPAFYQSYAQVSGPWVSLLAGTPIFYLTCRWIGSRVPVNWAAGGRLIISTSMTQSYAAYCAEP